MVTSIKHPKIHICEINGQRREVQQTASGRIYSRPTLMAMLDWLLIDGTEHDCADELRDLADKMPRCVPPPRVSRSSGGTDQFRAACGWP